jgi:hypothetical protein
MVKPERDVDAEVPTKVKNTDIDTMNTLMTSITFILCYIIRGKLIKKYVVIQHIKRENGTPF